MRHIENKKYFIIPYIHNISEITAFLFNKFTFTVDYRSLNKMDKFVKIHKDKRNTHTQE